MRYVRAPAGAGPATYYVVYYERTAESGFWSWILDPRYVHVEVWYPLGDDYWVAIKPTYCYLMCDIMAGGPKAGVNHVTDVQRVECARETRWPLFPLGFRNCVTLAKYALGLRSWSVLTPAQLRRHILKHRGSV